VLLIFSGIALAQEGQGVRYPFTGVVTGDYVNIRSGPDTGWYSVSRLMKGNQVRVVGEEHGWYKIVPPPGNFSWVKRQGDDGVYVERTTGDTGRVVADRVTVRAGSVMDETNRMAIQVLLGRDEQVKILGEEGDWFKIEPPEGSFVWISGQFIQPVQEQEGVPTEPRAEQIEVLSPEEREVAEGPVEEPETTTQPAATTRPAEEGRTPQEQRLGQFAGTLADLDKQYEAELEKPLDQQEWDELAAEYKAIAEQQENPAAASYAQQRLAVVQYQQQARTGLSRLVELRDRYQKSHTRTRQEVAQLQAKALEAEPKVWQGEGVLRASFVFQGEGMPRRYRLYDPARERTVAYLEVPADSGITVEKYLDRYVTVTGQIYYNPQLKINIIKALDLTVKEPPAAGQ